MSCDGSCCVAFTLSHTPDQMLAKAAGSTDPGRLEETFTLLGMLVPLTKGEARGRIARFGLECPEEWIDAKRYTCRHFGEETRLCGIYEDGFGRRRPWLCRDYPDSGCCDHGACRCKGQWTWVRNGHTRHCLGMIELERDQRHRARGTLTAPS